MWLYVKAVALALRKCILIREPVNKQSLIDHFPLLSNRIENIHIVESKR